MKTFFSFVAQRALRVYFAVTELKRLRGEESLGWIASCSVTIVLLQPRLTSPIPSRCHLSNGTASGAHVRPKNIIVRAQNFSEIVIIVTSSASTHSGSSR